MHAMTIAVRGSQVVAQISFYQLSGSVHWALVINKLWKVAGECYIWYNRPLSF